MASDNKKKPDNETARKITQDARNASVNNGRKKEEASLSFSFDNKPENGSSKAEKAAEGMPKAEDSSRSRRPVIEDKGSPAAYANGSRKQYGLQEKKEFSGVPTFRFDDPVGRGLPAELSGEADKKAKSAERPSSKEPDALKRPEKEQTGYELSPAAVSESFEAAREKLKKKMAEKKAERQEAARLAREAATERKRQQAREEAAARAAKKAEDARKAEAASILSEREADKAHAGEISKAADAIEKAEKASEGVKNAGIADAAGRAFGKVAAALKAFDPLAEAGTDSASKDASEGGEGGAAGGSDKSKAKSAAVKPAGKLKNEKTGGDASKVKKIKKTAASQTGQAVGKAKEKTEAGNEKTAKSGKKSKPVKLDKKGRPKKRFRWLWAIIKIMFALIIVGGISAGAYAAYTISHADPIHPDQIYSMLDVSTHIYNDKGKLIDELYYSENRELATYDEMPENLKNAFIAIEDKTFWTHHGFNIKRIFGAIWSSISGGGEISGTSTITQQLARNVFLPEEKSIRSIKRKIIEMYYAYQIEETLSKEEILAAYLNTIYLGYGCYGVETAAEKYFSCSINELSLEQCAALAALPQAPGIYQLIVTEPDEYTTDIGNGLYANDCSAERRNLVLDLMAEQGYVTTEEAEVAKKPLTDFLNPGKEFTSANSAFKDYLIETVIKDLMAQYELSEEQATKLVYQKGLHIYSTLDSQAQKQINKQFKKDSNFPDAQNEDAKVEAAMVITEVGTGQIKAMVGTRDVNGEKLFNRATSPRQPGSSIKPIAVYAPALQKSYEYQKDGKKFPFKDTGYDKQGTKYWGNYITAYSTVKDEKMTVKGKTWPLNFSKTYTGNKTFRTAIQQSINTCSVKILAQIGTDYSMEMVKKFGITTAVDDTDEAYNDVNLAALGLGAMTHGVTPLDMALAYAAFPNGGVRNSGICYTQVTDSEGNVLLEGKSEETRVLNKGVAFIMTDVLQTVVTDGIAYDAAIEGEKVGGKTGTTDQTWDIWFDGFTANYAAALWIGTDDNTPLTADTTSATAAKLWSRIMSNVKRAKGGTYKSRPDNVSIKNGEYFTKGTEPPDPPVTKKKESKADHSSTTEPDPNATDNTGQPADAAAQAAAEAAQAASNAAQPAAP